MRVALRHDHKEQVRKFIFALFFPIGVHGYLKLKLAKVFFFVHPVSSFEETCSMYLLG